MLTQGVSVKALIHITSDGFLNLNRVASEVGYTIDALPPVPPIFTLIQRLGRVETSEMFSVYNMGIGFCFIVSEDDVSKVLSILKFHGRKAYKIGHVTTAKPWQVHITQHKLKGEGKTFQYT